MAKTVNSVTCKLTQFVCNTADKLNIWKTSFTLQYQNSVLMTKLGNYQNIVKACCFYAFSQM